MQKKFTEKLWVLMKICIGQVIIFLIVCSVCLAHENYAQLLERRVTIALSSAPFEEALKEIEGAADVRFVYSMHQLHEEEPVSIQVANEKLSVILEDLFGPRQISYKVHEREATITLKKQKASTRARSSTAAGDEPMLREITGRVSDSGTQLPMAGVNILVKGTTVGATTDSDGQFAVEANTGDVLIFSFIGYATQERPVGDELFIEVALAEDIVSLKDVVINAGYWSVADRERTGNISRITSEEIQRQPAANPLATMIGRMPGVNIQQSTGMPGGAFTIEIRGRNSLRTTASDNGNLPLYIIDGIPFTSTSLTSEIMSSGNLQGGNPLSAINPLDIESVEVLKDADATAIYGSRGANGVVLITTKKGKEGKTRADINIYSGVGQVSRFLDLLTTEQYIEMRREAYANDGAPVTGNAGRDLLQWDTTRSTDWQKELIGGTANIVNAQASISGGNQHTQFHLGTGFYRETTVFPGDFGFRKVSGHLNLNHTSENDKLHTSLTVSYSSDRNKLMQKDPTSEAITLAPHAPAVYDENGNLNWENSTWVNPFGSLRIPYYNRTENLISNLVLGYELFEGLKLKSSFGYTTMHVDETILQPLAAQDPAVSMSLNRTALFGNSDIRTWITEPQAEYTQAIGKGKLNVLAGITLQENGQSGRTLFAYDFPSDALLESIMAAGGLFIFSNDASQYRYHAVFSRINYNWDEKYILNLTGRRDGSSRFGPDKRFSNFGAIGAAWIFSNEPFFKGQFGGFGKLRGSYGITGSDQIQNYGYLDSYSITAYPYNGVIGLTPTRIANPDYSWESNKKLEFGLELDILRERLNVSASWYRNRSSSQLVGFSLPAITGFSSVQYNLPATVQNSGWEFQLGWHTFGSGDFSWSSSIHLTIPQTKLLSYPEIETSPYANVYVVGESLYIKKSFRYSGIDENTGLYRFQDVNEDGSYNPADRTLTMFTGQRFYGGFQNGFKYKNLEVDFTFQFVEQTGNHVLNYFPLPGTLSNQPQVVMERWRHAGDDANIQKFTRISAGRAADGMRDNSDLSRVDASYIRLKNFSISYRIPSQWKHALHLADMRIYAQGQNLLTFTRYPGDPESLSLVTLPPLRIVTVGMHVSF